ncbi:hypothetical protein HMPREF9996_01648 [Aggregatibacter actinomycetemcomitans Y4]|nr:hypothetical protein HMPREF9996_01648 [Aggregatibacter actinomycetemcomitans Y4]
MLPKQSISPAGKQRQPLMEVLLMTAANKGWNLTTQGQNKTNVAPDETVDLNNTDNNIAISKTASDDNVTFNLARNINVQ